MQDEALFDSYKPLRNHIKQTGLFDSLNVFWSYIQWLQFNTPIPNNIETLNTIISVKPQIYITEWDLEILIRESIINSEQNNLGSQSYRKWSYFAGAINKLRDFEGEIAKKYIDKTNIFTEFFRIAHRQFPWQTKPNKTDIVRYLKIFSHQPLNDIIKNITGLTTEDLYLTGMLFWGFFINNYMLDLPIKIVDIPEIKGQNLANFLNCFSCELPALKKKILENREINEKFLYSFFPLRAYPIIGVKFQNKNSLLCPSSTLLVWRLTSGIYYEICNEKNFDNEFGKSFQNYVGEVIEATNSKNAKIYSEEEYYDGNNRKNTVDWIIEGKDSSLFIECKTKRMTILAKTEIKSEDGLDRDLNTLADAVFQVYKSLVDYLKNKYPSFKACNKKIFPLVITLEEWYFFGDKLADNLSSKVKQRFEENNMPVNWLSEMPYSICSIQEFETITQIIEKVGIKEFMEKKLLNQEKNKWAFHSFVRSEFPEYSGKIKILFPEDFDKIFPKRLIEKIEK